MNVRLAGRRQARGDRASSRDGGDLFEGHAGQPSALVKERLGDVIVEDRDALADRVLLFPGRRLHLLEAGAHDDLDVDPAEPKRRAAAVHRRVAAAEHDDPPADALACGRKRRWRASRCRYGYWPRASSASGKLEVAAARRAACRRKSRHSPRRSSAFRLVDVAPGDECGAALEHVADFLVDDGVGQAEFRDLAAHHAARARVAVEDDDLVAERREVARDGERRRPRADAGDAFAVARRRFGRGCGRRCRLCSRRRRASGGRSRPARLRPARRRQAGSQGRSQVRPRMPGKTLDFQLII